MPDRAGQRLDDYRLIRQSRNQPPVAPASPAPSVPSPFPVSSPSGIMSHLYILDDQYHRVLDLTQDDTATFTKGEASPVKMHLFQLYASPTLLAKVKSMEVDPTGTHLYLLTQGTDTSAPIKLATVDTRLSDANTCAGA